MIPSVHHYTTEQPWTIERYASLARAHELMREHAIRHLPVLDQGRLVGIVSMGDLHLLETIAEFPLDTVEVNEAMTPDPYIVRRNTPIDQVVEAMARHKYGCAIVIEGDAVVGIFTTIDALRAFADILRLGIVTAA